MPRGKKWEGSGEGSGEDSGEGSGEGRESHQTRVKLDRRGGWMKSS